MPVLLLRRLQHQHELLGLLVLQVVLVTLGLQMETCFLRGRTGSCRTEKIHAAYEQAQFTSTSLRKTCTTEPPKPKRLHEIKTGFYHCVNKKQTTDK